MKKLTLLAIAILFLAGCSTVTPSVTLPSQDLSALPSEGATKIVFFNTSNPVLYGDGSWKIGIKIDGKGIENLHLKRYAQIFLTPGNYKLELSHKDLFTFRDEYDITIGKQPAYFEVYNGLVSTKYKIHSELPDNFRGFVGGRTKIKY